MQIISVFIFIISGIFVCSEFYSQYKDEQNNREIATIFHEAKTEMPGVETNPETSDVTGINTEASAKRKREEMARLEALQRENSDISGWITITGTNIDYPVLQAADNSYYLTHNYKKEFSKNGSIFLDKDVNMEKPSTNYLIYGHRNKSGNMFEGLTNYTSEEFYGKYHVIRFTTARESAEYEIIAVFLSRVYYKNETDVFRYYYFTDANSREEFERYVNNCKEASLYDTGKAAGYGDQLLTLSTCEYSQKDGRLAVVARKAE